MTSLARLTAVLAFALACAAQPLALDACAVSCDAARAAQQPSLTAACHHAPSCATRIVQPTSARTTVSSAIDAPPRIARTMQPVAVPALASSPTPPPPFLSPPPLPLRV